MKSGIGGWRYLFCLAAMLDITIAQCTNNESGCSTPVTTADKGVCDDRGSGFQNSPTSCSRYVYCLYIPIARFMNVNAYVCPDGYRADVQTVPKCTVDALCSEAGSPVQNDTAVTNGTDQTTVAVGTGITTNAGISDNTGTMTTVAVGTGITTNAGISDNTGTMTTVSAETATIIMGTGTTGMYTGTAMMETASGTNSMATNGATQTAISGNTASMATQGTASLATGTAQYTTGGTTSCTCQCPP